MNLEETIKNAGINIIIRHEEADDYAVVEQLGKAAFGPGRFSRAAFRLREGVNPEPNLSYVAEIDDKVIGSIKLTRIFIGAKPALVLGPLMIDPTKKNIGIGRELMNRAIVEAQKSGHRFMVLVGDYAYYKAFGFSKVPYGKIVFPGPADPQRILMRELVRGVSDEYQGLTTRYFGN